MTSRFVFLFCLITLVAGAPVSAQDEDEKPAEDGKKVCVNARIVDNFDALSDRYVYVEARGNDHYLFTMQGTCFGLRNAKGIALKDTTSRICSDGFGEIVYRDMGSTRSCRIGKIEVVESKEDAAAIVNQLQKDDD
jgi:hypothetical protein